MDYKFKIRNKTHASTEISKTELQSAEFAYKAALEGIVLLENKGVLPLQQSGKIALYGAGAGMTIKGGSGSGEVNERHAISIEEGLEQAGFTVTTKSWIEDYKETYDTGLKKYREDFMKTHSIKDVVNIMADPFLYPYGRTITTEDIKLSETDTCIYVIARQTGEGADRKLERMQYQVSEEEIKNITICTENYKKVIVVINVGSSFDMKGIDEISGIDAVVYYCQQGSQGGKALAQLLLGKQNFSGRLSCTWAKDYYDFPYAEEYSYLNGNTTEEYYREGIYVGYRYFDSFNKEPRYPFGYGLSYTDFTMNLKELTAEGSNVIAKVIVTNRGEKFSGKEVVQLYISCPQRDIPKEYQKLAAFAKTEELSPGESQELTLTFNLADQASFYENTGEFILSAGEYLIRIGHDSRNTTICGIVELNQSVITKRCEHICIRQESLEEIKAPEIEYDFNRQSNCIKISIRAEEIVTETFVYEKPAPVSTPEIDIILNKIPTNKLIHLLTGPGYFGGKKWSEAPGAAGYTTGNLLEYGIPNVALADGPAGLRLQRISAVTKKGTLKMVDAQIDVLNYVKIPKLIRGMIFGNPKKDPLVYQYTTSFPVGQALAQTWNTDLIVAVGKAVSAEMTRYGVAYWLAPALNIMRNPLCGRNFEYYSEDPLLAGKIAAAMCCGVQSEAGNFVTVKHFCCNNQEDNRNYINENLNERALREIYLRNFEIAVKEGNPGSVMTSYNKVNGEYVNNSYDLVTKVLRNEWGYVGYVMTDWFATGKDVGNHVQAIKAGNDLIEPGNAYKDLLNAYKAGNLTDEEIRWCAANILKGVLSTQTYQEYKSNIV